MKINTLLIANRGEIACRIARTARALGITPVAVHSEADRTARHVREIGRSILIGAAPASESYLNIAAVLDAALRSGADAIHPGYGFLSENPDFARAVEAAGMIFVGPTAETLERFGDKASAKEAAIAANIPVIPGSEGARSDPNVIRAEVLRMGLPVLLKAVGGGGGRGQRLVRAKATLVADIEGALREARSTFGSEGLILERFLTDARHVEIQIIGDGDGKVLHLFERDCTLQRRHQKVIEEAPAFGLPRPLVDRMAADAVRLGESLNYRGLGTVEFLVPGEEYFFLEVNPRLQVEHPVTEAITGLDLIALHLKIAEGGGLALAQQDITCTGHAIEARLYAEDPGEKFAPSTGDITHLSLPDDIRLDSGVEEGDSISSFYDPMIAKLIVHAPDRATALIELARALRRTAVAGVETNRAFLSALVSNTDFAGMAVHTRWIDAHLEELTRTTADPRGRLFEALAAVLYVMQGRRDDDGNPWRNRDVFTGWRFGLGDDLAEACQRVSLARLGETACDLRVTPIHRGGHFIVYDAEDTPLSLSAEKIGPQSWRVTHAGESLIVRAKVRNTLVEIETNDACHLFEAAPPLAFASGDVGADRILTSPLTGLMIKVLVSEGDEVQIGDTVAILESMKLEISIKAATAGRARNISVTEGAMVDRGRAIVEIAEKKEAET
ncbi:biotin carboxylase N-terminal domain-containing protein [uncultured Sneathiella sp.]|uniref:ATP-binding protein n=1 Tax=uncultured Sneathiella sp. TaxID=879315 RepID=UPI0030EE2A9A